jgi:hypothetical protein
VNIAMSRGIIIGLGSLFGVGVISSIAAMKSGSDDEKTPKEKKVGIFEGETPYAPPINRTTKPDYPAKSDGGYTGYYGGKKSKSKKNRSGKKKSVKKGKKKNHKKH